MSTDVQSVVGSGLDRPGGRRRRGGSQFGSSGGGSFQQQQQHKKSYKSSDEGSGGGLMASSRGGHRCPRKRPYSGFASSGNTKFSQPHKKRKQMTIPPTKFLLGGNINDPLNLNSLQDEEVNRAMNAVTPESSPIPTPQHRKGEVEVIIPPNINDPLNLAGCEEDNASYEALLSTPIKKVRKKNKKKRQRSSTNNESGDGRSDESKTEESLGIGTEGLEGGKDSLGIEERLEGSEENQSRKTSISSDPLVLENPPLEEGEKLGEIEGGAEPGPNTVLVTTPLAAGRPPPPTLHLVDSGGVNKESLGFKKPLKRSGGDGGTSTWAWGGGGGGGTGGRKFDSKDKIVSPVIPQPGAWKNPSHRFRRHRQRNQPKTTPTFREKDKRFQYGNYNRYYGYRNPNNDVDPRLKLFETRRELFEGKDVLDIGCNTGHITLRIARDLKAKRVVGLDVDRTLIEAARGNVKHYVGGSRGTTLGVQQLRPPDEKEKCDKDRKLVFPISMPIVYGSLDIPGSPTSQSFPRNVSFVQGNYVLQSDALLELEQPQFDAILCLSVTKWFHLNWGDKGLKNAFKRMFAQLRPGGVLILEPQSWTSYKKKKSLTESIWKNYSDIKLFPTMFTEYLLTDVGFTKCELLGSPFHPSKGFQRPIKIFTKGTSGGDETLGESSILQASVATAQSQETLTGVAKEEEEVESKNEIMGETEIQGESRSIGDSDERSHQSGGKAS